METNCVKQTMEALSELVGLQRKLVPVCAVGSEVAGQIHAALDKLGSITEQKVQILVIGQFASGKYTLLDALLGEELSLTTHALQSASIPMELRYGTERRAIIYPKKEGWHSGDSPIEITLEELKEYRFGWNHNSDDYPDKLEFERAEIFLPNPALKNGTTLLEVPSKIIFDPTHRNYCVFQQYLHRSNIILYVVDGLHIFRGDEKCLEQICSEHPTVIAVGYLNSITQSARAWYFDEVSKAALRYTSVLGSDAIHFIDARDALKAKMAGDYSLLERSQFERLEHYLLNELFLKINVGKIDDIIQRMEQINKALSNQIEIQYNISAPDDSQIGDAFQERSQELLGAQLQIELIRQELNNLYVRYK